MIKVFTTEKYPKDAGDYLTQMFNDWVSSLNQKIEIKDIHSNSNKYGWMLVINYEYV